MKVSGWAQHWRDAARGAAIVESKLREELDRLFIVIIISSNFFARILVRRPPGLSDRLLRPGKRTVKAL